MGISGVKINTAALGGLLAQRGMTRVDLAKAIRRSPATVTAMCAQDNLQPKTARRLADALGVDVRIILVGGELLPDYQPEASHAD